MARVRMFGDEDPLFRQVRELALALPEAQQKVSHGRPAFFTGKVFAYYGAAVRVDQEWVQHRQAVLVLPEQSERQALLEEQRSFVPAYLGPSGWIGLDLDEDTDWTEVAELLEESYRRTAPRRLVALLTGR
jgi:predicted DNA-binding protein (MmcQ/YjbR family)